MPWFWLYLSANSFGCRTKLPATRVGVLPSGPRKSAQNASPPVGGRCLRARRTTPVPDGSTVRTLLRRRDAHLGHRATGRIVQPRERPVHDAVAGLAASWADHDVFVVIASKDLVDRGFEGPSEIGQVVDRQPSMPGLDPAVTGAPMCDRRASSSSVQPRAWRRVRSRRRATSSMRVSGTTGSCSIGNPAGRTAGRARRARTGRFHRGRFACRQRSPRRALDRRCPSGCPEFPAPHPRPDRWPARRRRPPALDILTDLDDPRGAMHRTDLFVASSQQIVIARLTA